MEARRAELARAGAALALAAALLVTAALADGTRRPSLPPAKAAELWDAALVARNENRPREALAATRRLLATYPRDGRYLELSAVSLGALGDRRGEAAAWEQHLAWSATPLEACPRIGLAYEAVGGPPAALDAHARCLALLPGDADLRYYHARALAASGRGPEAEAAFAALLADFPAYTDAALALGRLKLERGDHAGAAALIEPVAAAKPDSPDPLMFSALLDLARGEHARARASLRRAIKASPGYTDLYRVLARVCDAQKDDACAAFARDAVRDLDAGRPARGLPAEAP